MFAGFTEAESARHAYQGRDEFDEGTGGSRFVCNAPGALDSCFVFEGGLVSVSH